MRKIYMTGMAVLLAVVLHAQESTFNAGDKVVNLTLGLGSTLYSGGGYSTTLPPVAVSAEFGVKDDFLTEGMSLGVGGLIGYTQSTYELAFFADNYEWKYSSLVIGARGAVHYPLVDKLDTYGGLMLAYNALSVNAPDVENVPYSADSGGIVLGFYLGGRYYFTDNIAAVAELGYGIAWINVGLALKL